MAIAEEPLQPTTPFGPDEVYVTHLESLVYDQVANHPQIAAIGHTSDTSP